MIEYDWEKIGSAVLKHRANIISSAFSAQNFTENPKKLAEFRLKECMFAGSRLLATFLLHNIDAPTAVTTEARQSESQKRSNRRGYQCNNRLYSYMYSYIL